jgi:hypothetical protein
MRLTIIAMWPLGLPAPMTATSALTIPATVLEPAYIPTTLLRVMMDYSATEQIPVLEVLAALTQVIPASEVWSVRTYAMRLTTTAIWPLGLPAPMTATYALTIPAMVLGSALIRTTLLRVMTNYTVTEQIPVLLERVVYTREIPVQMGLSARTFVRRPATVAT